MRLRMLSTLCSLFLLMSSTGGADDYSLSPIDVGPDEISDAVAAQITPQGVELTGPKRGYARMWLVKSITIPADFKATSSVKYPFVPGQLLGVLAVPKRAGFTDFRGNELETGTYTLRYGRQPMDGNHIGTSDLADFLVVIPAGDDEDPAVISDLQKIASLSAEASGTTHPAILSLQPVKASTEAATLTHEEEREFWVLQLNATVQRGDKTDKLPLRLVVVGISEG